MENVQDLIRTEEEVMKMVGHIVWSFEDTCSSSIFTEFYQPLQRNKGSIRNTATNSQDDDSDASEGEDEQEEHWNEEEDTHDILKRYYQQTMLQVSEFTETILYSILFFKWAESRNDDIVATATPSQWKHSLPDHLRRATRQKANRIIGSLMGLARLRLDALDLVHDALHRAEQLANEYIERRSDYAMSTRIGPEERRTALLRLEEDAINYVNRQIKTQLKMHQQQANQELYNSMTDIINASIENEQYCQRLHKWARTTVAHTNMSNNKWNTTNPICNGDSSSDTSLTDPVDDEESDSSDHTPSREERATRMVAAKKSAVRAESPVHVIYFE